MYTCPLSRLVKINKLLFNIMDYHHKSRHMEASFHHIDMSSKKTKLNIPPSCTQITTTMDAFKMLG